MTDKEIAVRFKKAIDQWYHLPNKGYVRENQLHHIGGLLQGALHVLSTDSYYAVKQYVYDKYGYDPVGCRSGQINLDEYFKEDKP